MPAERCCIHSPVTRGACQTVIDDRAARKVKVLIRGRQLESQLIEDEPAGPPQRVNSPWRALAEGDEPFASNGRKRSRPARYWET